MVDSSRHCLGINNVKLITFNEGLDISTGPQDAKVHTETSLPPHSPKPATQHVTFRASMLKRPQSSHEDPAAGFSFAKAAPTKPLDFSRKLGSIAMQPSKNETSQDTAGGSTGGALPPSHPRQRSSGTINNGIVDSTTSHPTGQIKVPILPDDVPFPKICAPGAGIAREQTMNVDSHQPSNEPKAKVILKDSFDSGDVTLIGTNLNDNEPTPNQGVQLNHLNMPMPKQLAAAHPTFSNMTPEQLVHPQAPQPAVSNGHHHPRRGNASSKVVKPRKVKHGMKAHPAVPTQSITLDSSTEQQLVSYLTYKMKCSAEEREAIKVEQQLKDAELQNWANVSNELFNQLQHMTQRYNAKEEELSKITEAKSGWSAKVRKLTDFVKGLMNDHNRLRDDARDLREQQTNVLHESTAIVDTLRQINQGAEQNHTRSQELVKEAHQDIKALDQTMRTQQTKLQEDEALLASERERNNRLEEHITAFTTSQTQLLTLFGGHRDIITGKLNELLEKAEQAPIVTPPPPNTKMEPMVEQCLSLLKELPKFDDIAKKEDVAQLNESLRGCMDK